MRVVVHVGLTKTGTTYLQGLLAAHHEALLAAGVLHPLPRPAAQFHGAVDVRRSAAAFGLDPGLVDGTWADLCRRGREHVEATGGTALLGHEVLAGATPEQVGAALAPLAGLEVHVVVTARDLGRQAVAHWQERVKLGDTRSFATFEQEELLADGGRDRGPDAGGVRPRFWHGQDFADTLGRWCASLPAGRGHLVVCPAPGAPPGELWRRYAAAVGVPAGVVDPDAAVAGNPSLGAAEVALVRAVHERLGDRLPPEVRNRVVKRGWAEEELVRRSGTPARTPAALGPLLGRVTDLWLEEVRAAGHLVHGDPGDLAPVVAGPGDPPPDVPLLPGDDPDEVVRVLLRRASAPRGGRWSRLLRRPT